MTSVADRDLVALIQEGDDSALASLIARYQRRLLAYLRRFLRDEETARELVQDTFMKVYRHAHLFQREASFANWLFRIAHNVAMSYLRKKRIRIGKKG